MTEFQKLLAIELKARRWIEALDSYWDSDGRDVKIIETGLRAEDSLRKALEMPRSPTPPPVPNRKT